MKGRSNRALHAPMVTRFAALYRAACADLALADAYQLPPQTVHYLHQLVGRAHNQLYRSRTFRTRTWFRELFVHVPQRLFRDGCLRLAMAIFWGLFLLSAGLAYHYDGFAEEFVGEEPLSGYEHNFSKRLSDRDGDENSMMAGFYIRHNGSIGLRCFALGLVLGIGGLFTLVFNAALIGAIFGHMATVPQRENFFDFVTAHGPFELTAVVLGAAAGMRLGFSLVHTQGYSRMASLRRAANQAMPTMALGVVLFAMAAMIEGFLSPSGAPYRVKAGTAVVSAAMLLFYFIVLGWPRRA
jgi:uncharacterized membrane protein SpoIIM required for sporulation